MNPLSGPLAVDTETTGLNPHGSPEESEGIFPARPFFVSITDYDGETISWRWEVDPYTREVKYFETEESLKAYQEVKQILETDVDKVLHNANFDRAMLEKIGINIGGKLFDTKIMAHVDNSSRRQFGLKPLCKSILGIDDGDQKQLADSVRSARRAGKKKGYALAEDLKADYWLGSRKWCKVYGETDTERTMGLYWFFEEKYKSDATYRSLVDMEIELQDRVYRMQMKGARLSQESLADQDEYYSSIIYDSRKDLEALGYGELNTRSSKQMQELFYSKLKLAPVLNKKTGKLTTDSKTLSMWADMGIEAARIIVRKNAAEHELGTFIQPFQELVCEEPKGSGVYVLHPNYNTCGPVTGRMSCSKPNLQNIPNPKDTGEDGLQVAHRIREAFVPREGTIWYLPDYSQVEVWVAMFLSGDEFGIKHLLEGTDMHLLTATKLWGMRPDFEKKKSKYRKSAKMILFGMLYGSGVAGIMESARCDWETANNIRSTFHETYAGVFAYMDRLSNEIEIEGFITSPFGRVYRPHSSEAYKSLNYMVQGTCADIMKRAIINVFKLLDRNNKYRGIKPLLTVHDEIILEVPKWLHSKKLMREIVGAMQSDFHKTVGIPQPFNVGMKISSGSWAKPTEIDL